MRPRLIALWIPLLAFLGVLGSASAGPAADSTYTLYHYNVQVVGFAEETLSGPAPGDSGTVRHSFTVTIRGVGIHPFTGADHHSAVYVAGSGTVAASYAVNAKGDEEDGEKPRCSGKVSYRIPVSVAGGYVKNYRTKLVLRMHGRGRYFDPPLEAKIFAATGCGVRWWGSHTPMVPAGKGLTATIWSPWEIDFRALEWKPGQFPVDQLYHGRGFTLDTGPGHSSLGWKVQAKMIFTPARG